MKLSLKDLFDIGYRKAGKSKSATKKGPGRRPWHVVNPAGTKLARSLRGH